MGCYYYGKKNDHNLFCPFSGIVVQRIKVLSTNCLMMIRDPLSGNLTPALEKNSIKLNLGEYCLAANLFLEEMDHGCPKVTGYNYRTNQISNIPWKRFNEAPYGTYELLGITFSPAYFQVIGLTPQILHNNKTRKKHKRR